MNMTRTRGGTTECSPCRKAGSTRRNFSFAPAGGLAARLWDDARGHGIDGGVLEAGVARFGGAVSTAAGERATRQSHSGAKDRPRRRRPAGGVVTARLAEEQFRAAASDSGVAGPDALSGKSGAGVQPDCESDSEGAGGCELEAGLGGDESSLAGCGKTVLEPIIPSATKNPVFGIKQMPGILRRLRTLRMTSAGLFPQPARPK